MVLSLALKPAILTDSHSFKLFCLCPPSNKKILKMVLGHTTNPNQMGVRKS